MTTPRPKWRPGEVQIGPILYRIEWVDSSVMDKPLDMKASPQRFGDCTPAMSRIRVATDLSLPVQRVTLQHEISHAICDVFGPHRHQVLRDFIKQKRRSNSRIEEVYVSLMENWLSVMRDNPKVMAWINAG